MVMNYERGRTLQEHITARADGRCSTRTAIRRLFDELLNGLRDVHPTRCCTWTSSPANIFMRNDGTPVLLDFGAARETLCKACNLPPMYTPGFAAPELYRARARSGPWTDIYAIGA